MPYLGNDLTTVLKQGKRAYKYVATAGQTVFTGTDANSESLSLSVDSFVNVFLNGIRLIKTDDYSLSTDTVTLVSGAALDDELIVIVDVEAASFNTYTQSETDARITSRVNALIDAAPEALNTLNELAAALGDDANFATTVTNALNARYTSTEVDNLLANINSIIVSSTEPAGATEGNVWYDTNLNLLKAYDGANWNKVSPIIPTITSISGSVYEGVGGNITITGTGFLSDDCSVEFSGSFTTASVNATASSDTSLVVAVPSAAYAATGSVTVKVTNADNAQSLSSSFNVLALPSGGTIVTEGSYRYHIFKSSSTLVVPSGFSVSVDYLIVAGGGAGGNGNSASAHGGGGGGAGGMLWGAASISQNNYGITVGGGGANVSLDSGPGGDGGNSSFNNMTSIGGGGGGSRISGESGRSGGSGGGATTGGSPGAGTSGQGNAGGSGSDSGAGGGGRGAAGANVSGSSSPGAPGGIGSLWSPISTAIATAQSVGEISGSDVYFAGGGGGGTRGGVSGSGAGALGGGGDGGVPNQNGSSGVTNTGGGGGGGGQQAIGGNGGSGIVIIRYQL